MVQFQPLLLVRQHLDSHKLADIPSAVHAELNQAGLARTLKPGASVAIGAGSRGIANIDVIVRAAVDWWKAQGMRPFIFPAMGTHGAATAKGQAAVLAKYGITESTMGCPVRSSLAVVPLGRSAEGIETVMDKTAWAADGVMLCGRVKWHTDFVGRIESGLFKMMAIGMGKLAGAQRYHAHALTMGLEAMVLSVGRQVLKSGKILGGLAILEDGNHDTARVAAVPAEGMEGREAELLALVKTWMPRIPVSALDFLLINEMGKNWSGAGIDPKVVNRSINAAYNPWDDAPRVARIYIRGISKLSYGNATGIGLADVVHTRVVRSVKRGPTYVNGVTSGPLASVRTPIHFSSDRKVLETVWRTAGRLDPLQVSLGWIRNTQDLTVMAFTENLRGELEANPAIEVLGPARELEFDTQGNLADWLA